MNSQLLKLKSDRKVRAVIIPSGKRARGRFPSLKADSHALSFESLHEEHVQQICEVSNSVRFISARPLVLRLTGRRPFHYTPDLVIEHARQRHQVVLEAKGDIYLTRPSQRERIAEIDSALRNEGILFFVILQSDLTKDLIERTAKALSRRPWPAHGTRGKMDHTLLWQQSDTNWISTAQECDALLERLMNRDVSETLNSATQAAGGAK
jgi:hypothetical protein